MHKKNIVTVLFMFICLIGFSQTAHAYDEIDYKKSASLMIMLDSSDIEVSLYRIGEITSENELYLAKEYSKYAVVLDETTSESSSEAALVLDTYFRRDNVKPLQAKATNASGNVLFDDLELGVYLVSCEYKFGDDEVIIHSPMIFNLPMWLNEKWEYNLNSDVKNIKRSIQDRCLVYKIWHDDEESRPEEITVQLLRDGTVFDEQVLHAQNSWRYLWDDLEGAHVWSVIEKEIPEGYTLGMSIDGNVYVLENREESTEEEPIVPENPDDKIPQTGQMWWPVYTFAMLGIGLIAIGIVSDRICKN